MGNRCMLCFPDASVAVYLHWNGGLESVVGFLNYANAKGVRASDPTYGVARIVQIAANYFGGTTSIGVEGYNAGEPAELRRLDPGDNGVFIATGSEAGWKVTGHYSNGLRTAGDKFDRMLKEAQAHVYNKPDHMPAKLATANDKFFDQL